MVILKVGLLHEPPVLCTSSKIHQLSSFHFKISHYIYTLLYIQEKQVELHLMFQNFVAAQISFLDLVLYLSTLIPHY